MSQHNDFKGPEISTRALWITGLILVFCFVVSVYGAMPKNIFTTATVEKIRPVITGIWPQGWGFFTKDPDSPALDVFAPTEDGDITSILATPQGRPDNLFGLSRTSRAQGTELAILTSYVEDDDWLECTGSREACLEEATESTPIEMTNDSPVPTVCGEAVLTNEKPTPWAYRDLVEEDYRLQSSAHVMVDCQQGDEA